MTPIEAIKALRAAGFSAWQSRHQWPKRINYVRSDKQGKIIITDNKVDDLEVAEVIK